MTVFDSTTSQEAQATQESNNQTSFIEQLVNAKGETWKDPEVIAKGKLEADALIEQQRQELQELRERVAKEEYSKTLLETLQEKPAAPIQQPEVNDNREAAENTTLNADTVKGLVAEYLSETQQKERATLNLQKVEDALAKSLGDNATQIVKQKAAEMGVDINFLRSVAEQSPDAFLKLVVTEAPTEGGHVTPNKTNTAAGFDSSSERNWDYYERLRRENRKEYWTPAIQNQMVEDKQRLGTRWKP
jgi:hypothetical protein